MEPIRMRVVRVTMLPESGIGHGMADHGRRLDCTAVSGPGSLSLDLRTPRPDDPRPSDDLASLEVGDWIDVDVRRADGR